MISQQRMVQMFTDLDDEARRYVLAVLQGEYDRVQRTRRPVLRLVQGGMQAEGISKLTKSRSRRAAK